MNASWALLDVVLTAWVLPFLVVAGFAREMESRDVGTDNYRGRTVFLGLGVAWLVLVLGAIAGGTATVSMAGGSVVVLVTVAFALGVLDDALGSGAERGFGGHLRALRDGRLTTGLAKALGIGVVALATSPATYRSWSDGYDTTTRVVAYLSGAAVIALTANLVNLTDLRPARALKAYVALALPAGIAVGVLGLTGSWTLRALAGALLVLGPVVAVWRYDAAERGMLGDAGANAAGAFAGYLAASVLPMPWLAAWAAVLLGLNLLSERVSFSSLVERNRAMRWVDGLGREKSAETGPE